MRVPGGCTLGMVRYASLHSEGALSITSGRYPGNGLFKVIKIEQLDGKKC